MKLRSLILFAGVVSILFASMLTASAQTKKVYVRFKTGTNGGTYSNTVSGYGTVEYYVEARAGQTMAVKLTSSNASMYFNIRAGANANEAMSDQAREATEFSGQLPADGTYVIQVYLVRAEARRNKRAVRFKLRLDIN